MELILLRHGKAEDTNRDNDFARVLVEKGYKQARRAAQLLKATENLPDVVLTSPLVRACQTAVQFCKTAKLSDPVVQDWIACGMTPETAIEQLAGFKEFNRVMIVGHEPDFSGLVESVLGVSGGAIDFKKGAIACLTITPPKTRGTLHYLIPPVLASGTKK
jgi:phosphohistidine phosphatase